MVMETLFVYLIKSSGLIAVFYLAYFFMLRKETFFSGNRWFLLAGLITSVILPFVYFTKIIWVEPIATTPIDWSTLPVTNYTEEKKLEDYLLIIMAIVYGMGILVLLTQFAFDFYSLRRLLKGKSIERQADFKFIDIKENIAPFSYFNTIVYNSSLYSTSELENILEHEKVHSEQNHTIDVLLSRLFCIVFWFNPFLWLYKKAILQNLEFIADNEASKRISDKKAYQITLLKITTHENCVAITNHFYQSLIKKRIVMLNKNQSKKWNSWKYATVFPALVAFVFLFQIEVVAQENETKTDKIKEALHDIEINLDTISKEKKTSNSAKNKTAKTDENNVKISNNTIAQLDDKSNIQSALKQDIESKPLIVIDGIKKESNFKIEEIPTDQIAKIDVLKGIKATGKYGENGKNGAIEITTKEKTTSNNFTPIQRKAVQGFQILKQDQKVSPWKVESVPMTNISKEVNDWKVESEPIKQGIKQDVAITNNIDYNKVVIIIDGKISNYRKFKKLNPNKITSILVRKMAEASQKNKDEAVQQYGEKALNGIIEVETKALFK